MHSTSTGPPLSERGSELPCMRQPLWTLWPLQQLRVVLVPVLLLFAGSSGGGRSSTGGSGSSARPRWSPAGSSVVYTPTEVLALTPVRNSVENLAKVPDLRDVFLCWSCPDSVDG